MKLTKKVLSLILAAALLVGTVAIAANAAEPVTTYEGSVMSYIVTSDKDVSDGVAEVKPGETITVYVSMTTNYYPGTSGGEDLFWSKGFFDDDATEVTMAEVLEERYLHTTNYPAGDDAYPSDMSPDIYWMYLNNRKSNTDFVNNTVEPFTEELLYTVTLTVLDDEALVGKEAQFILPASKLMANGKTGRAYNMGMAVSKSEVFKSNAKTYAETANVDSLTIKIVGDEPVVEYANLDALKAALDKAATTSTANCTETTVNEFNAAKQAAQTLYDSNPLAADQEAVNKAADRLEKAIIALAPLAKVDYSELDKAIQAYNDLLPKKDDYSNWADYEDLFEAADAIVRDEYDNENGDKQAEVDAAVKALNEFTLTTYGVCGYAAYDKAVADAAALAEGEYTTSSWAAAKVAEVVAANTVEPNLPNKDGNQDKIDAAAKAINDAIALLEKKASVKALEDAVAAEPKYAQDVATPETWDAYAKALAAAQALLDNADDLGVSQAQAIADAAQAVVDANAALEMKTVDLAKWNDAAANIPASLDAYKPASVAAYEAAKAAAEEAKAAAVEALDQAALDAAAEALTAAIALLEVKADNSALVEAVDRAEDYDEDAYTPNSWAAADLVTVIADAKAVIDNGDASDKDIADAVAAIEAAEAKLVEKAVKTALEAAIARAQAKADNEAAYTPDSFAAADLANVLAAANVVLADANATDKDVADAVAAIEAAEAKLVIKADKGDLDTAIKAAQAKVENKDAYTPASFEEANLEAVIADAQLVYENGNATAEDVAGAINALTEAAAKLVEKANKEALVAAINKEVELKDATEETLAEYNAKLQAAQAVLADDNATEAAVLEATNNLLAAIDALDYYKPCDYTAYNDAVKAANELVAGEYTTSSWTAADIAAVLADNFVEEGLLDKDTNQADINAAAANINAAIALLEKKASVTALEDAVAAPAKVAEEYATADTWDAYAKALAAANEMLAKADDLGVSQDQAIADAAQAVVDANAALVERDADYTAIDEALKVVAEKGDLSQYTQATVKELQKALDAVVEGLGASRQDDIEKWAEDIVKAANALEISKAAITALEVDLSDYIKRETRPYTFTVAGEPTKVQLITSTGSTLTYDRNHRNVVIVSYNAAGEVIDYTKEEPAYEEWTISVSLKADDYKARAKYGTLWEAFAYEFSVEYVDPAKEEIPFVAAPADGSAEAGKTLALKKNTKAVMTVVAPNTVIKVQLAFPSFNGTSTYTASNATVVDNGDGTSTWTIVRNFSKAGSYDMVLKLKDVAGWYDAVADAIAVEVK